MVTLPVVEVAEVVLLNYRNFGMVPLVRYFGLMYGNIALLLFLL